MRSRRQDLAFRTAVLLLPVSLALYLLSLTMDVVLVETKVQIFGIAKTSSEGIRLLSTIRTLYENGDMTLAGIIAAFTILFPVGKYIALAFVAARSSNPSRSPITTWVKNLGQWSMGDVYVVATLVVVLRVNTSASLAHLNVIVQPGLYIFAASVIGSMVASVLLAVVGERRPGRWVAESDPAASEPARVSERAL